jgi:hypothetical protein
MPFLRRGLSCGEAYSRAAAQDYDALSVELHGGFPFAVTCGRSIKNRLATRIFVHSMMTVDHHVFRRLLGGIGVLAAVVESGNFARAGEALGLTSSGVNKQRSSGARHPMQLLIHDRSPGNKPQRQTWWHASRAESGRADYPMCENVR